MRKLITLSLLLFAIGCSKPDYLNDFKNEKPTYVGQHNADFGELVVNHAVKRPGKRVHYVQDHLPLGCSAFLLDFDGGRVENTSWNYNGPIAYDHSGLTLEAQLRILDSMRRRYSPLNIYITVDSAEWVAKANPYKRNTQIYTTSYEWYGSGAGGVSITGSFTTGSGSPSWVFTSQLGYVEKYLIDAGSHEGGHTLGLRHQALWSSDCTTLINPYNPGFGDWAPIMGVGYNKPNVTWHIGPTAAGCNVIQRDLDEMAAVVGYK